MVDAIIHHHRRDPDRPDAFATSLLEDEICIPTASWRGKPVIKTLLLPTLPNLFAEEEECDSFVPLVTPRPQPDFPDAYVGMLLTADGAGYRWSWSINSRRNPRAGSCGPNEGRVDLHGRRWVTADAPLDPAQ